jgi:hypothetical protein
MRGDGEGDIGIDRVKGFCVTWGDKKTVITTYKVDDVEVGVSVWSYSTSGRIPSGSMIPWWYCWRSSSPRRAEKFARGYHVGPPPTVLWRSHHVVLPAAEKFPEENRLEGRRVLVDRRDFGFGPQRGGVGMARMTEALTLSARRLRLGPVVGVVGRYI